MFNDRLCAYIYIYQFINLSIYIYQSINQSIYLSRSNPFLHVLPRRTDAAKSRFLALQSEMRVADSVGLQTQQLTALDQVS